MSSTLEDVDGNDNITEEKDSEAKPFIKCIEEEVLVNGDGHIMDHKNLNGDARDEQNESVIDKATKLSSPLNGIKRDTDQEFKFILAEYEHTKNELSKLQTDYKLSLEREKSLCEKLQDYHGKEDSSVNDLSRVNEDLRKNLDAVLEELKSSKEELKRLAIDLEAQSTQFRSNMAGGCGTLVYFDVFCFDGALYGVDIAAFS